MSKKLTPYSASMRDLIDAYSYRAIYGKSVYVVAKETGGDAIELLSEMRKSPEFKQYQERLLTETIG